MEESSIHKDEDPIGSASINTQFNLKLVASAAAKFTATVVFPTPPFLFVTASMFFIINIDYYLKLY